MDRQEPEQHRESAKERVDEELRGGGGGFRASTHADEQEDRDEAQLIEEEPVDEIERGECPKERRLQKQDEADIELRDAVPQRKQRKRRDGRGENQQHQAEAVRAKVILDVQRRNPVPFFDELQAARGAVVVKRQRQCCAKSGEGDPEPGGANEKAFGGQERDEKRARQRQKSKKGKKRIAHAGATLKAIQ